MYFDEAVNRKVLSSIQRLICHRYSHLWIDIVAKSVIERESGFPEVDDFLRGMEKLGEPFIFGLDDASTFFEEQGYVIDKVVPSNCYKTNLRDPVFTLYNFYILSCNA